MVSGNEKCNQCRSAARRRPENTRADVLEFFRRVFRETFSRRVPGQRGALDAHGKFKHAFERLEISKFPATEGFLAAHHFQEILDEHGGFLKRFARELLGHDRGRRQTDRAAVAVELDLDNLPARHFRRNFNLIAAKRVILLRLNVGRHSLAAIARTAVVVKDDVLIKLFEHGDQTLTHGV